MAQIWDYIAQYNPTGFYEDNRSKSLRNDYMQTQISAANQAAAREKKIMALEDAIANGDKSKLEALGVYAPEKRGKMIDNEEKMVEYARPFAQAYMQASPENRAKVYGQIYGKLKDVMDVSDMPMQWNESVDGIMETLANSDPTKIQQERQAEIARQAQQDMLNRQISLVNYQRSMANQETADKVRKIQEAMESGRISPEQGQAALNELELGIKPQNPIAGLEAEYNNPDTTPERRQEILGQVAAWKQANMGGSIAADIQRMNAYEQKKKEIESDLGRKLTSEEDMVLRSNYGIKGSDITKDINSSKADDQIRVNDAKNRNAIDLENVKQGNRITMADVNAENARKLENIKQENRIGLAYVNDEISKGKELRELNNKKSFEEFKNNLPTKDALELMRVAAYMTEQGKPTTYEQLAAQKYEDALATAELDKQYKQAQIDKLTEETLNAGKTGDIKNYEYLRDQGTPMQEAIDKAFGNKGTTVNVGKEEDRFKGELATNDAKEVVAAEKEAMELGNQLALLDNALLAINDDNLYQGTGGEAINAARTALASIGIDVKGLDSAQELNQVSAMLKGRLRKDLMPGPLSDRDLQFLINMTPGLDKTDVQNAAIIRLYLKMYKRQKELLDFKANYGRTHNTLTGWQEAAKQAGLDREVFSDTDRALAEGRRVRPQQNRYSNYSKDDLLKGMQ